MSFSDDELPPANSSAGPMLGNAERVRLVAYNNDKAPLVLNRQQVLLELIDTSSARERSGLDLVAVLDVSESMGRGKNWKLDKLKTAMKFVISKLGPMDRLSMVSFSTTATKLCSLRCMTEASKEHMKKIVEKDLYASGTTNMKAGLETALKVIAGRQPNSGRGRVASIFLMSDGEQDQGEHVDVRKVPIGNVAVYTFGFGAKQDAEVLEAIAGNSHGGTFYDVKDGENLSEHFSALLAGLLSVVVQDVKLTVWEEPGHSQIEREWVDAGSYLPEPRERDDNTRSVTVNFGYLYSGEVRKVIVDLLLPAVHRGYRATVLNAQCTYSIQGRTFYSPRGGHLSCFIRRTRSASTGAMDPEVRAELIRRRHIIVLEEAIATKNINSARGKLAEADKALDIEQSKSKHPLIDMLKAELAKLLKLATWVELLAGLLASKRSHDCQRFASRGDLELTLFKPQSMGEYVDQAKKFEEDPSKPPPPVAAERRPEPPRWTPRMWARSHERKSSGWWAWAMVLLCTALAIGVILAGAAVFAVYLLYQPRMPYLAVSDARLELLQYGQDGTIDYLQVSITVLAVNNNSKADASFSSVNLALAFQGADVALLRAEPFVVARETSLPLQYNVVSAGRALDPAGMHSMDESLKAGVVPFDLFGKARTRWKVGVFVRLRFWTRISCRLRFFFPGNGTVLPTDRAKCHSRSP